jgi:cytochrome c-type biogenesis protein CcmE
VSNQDDFFTPEEVDSQIDQVSQLRAGELVDAQAMAYLRSFYGQSARQEQEALDRIWNRVAEAAPSFATRRTFRPPYTSEEATPMQNQPTLLSNSTPPRQGRTLWQRLGLLAAVVVLAALVGSLALVFYASRQNSSLASGGPSQTNSTSTTAVPTYPSAPFKVTSIDISVTPESIAGIPCGTFTTVTYKATIHVAPNGPGGTVQFGYTVNNGRSQKTASVHFASAQTSQTYSFTWSGALPADHTYPQPGGISVTSPNQLTSALVGPSGRCGTSAAFTVTRVDMAVSPTSLQGMSCGATITVTYTATIHVAANSPGGTVQFGYTVNNGRSQSTASVHFAPGQTSQTYSFTWHGALPADHTYPEQGGISVTSPNQLISPLVGPSGRCQ